ncbi:MAG: hypothetical protein ACOCP4_04710 [Candidatus Woesearchaeota archaeon]
MSYIVNYILSIFLFAISGISIYRYTDSLELGLSVFSFGFGICILVSILISKE